MILKRFNASASRSVRAFTLVEVMISIALALVLMVGINEIFKMTGDAVGASQTISDQVRDARSAQTILGLDFRRFNPNAPLLINMVTQPAFRNLADKNSDIDGNSLTLDLNANGNEGETTIPGETTSPAIYNSRNSRLDTISFFARGQFQRQTGGTIGVTPGPLVADMTAREAWVWIGHLSLINSQSTPVSFGPGAPNASATVKNDNNFYSTQWVLGRQQMLLVEPGLTSGAIDDRAGNPQFYYSAVPTNDQYFPMTYGLTIGTAPNRFKVEQSRYDLGGSTTDEINTTIANMSTRWWEEMFGLPTNNSGVAIGPLRRFESASFLQRPTTAGDPLVNPTSFAKMQPAFIPGCSQFIVEFAGDYFSQNDGASNPLNEGNLLDVYSFQPDPTIATDPGGGNETDGVTDFVVIRPAAGGSYRQTRWYGMPRDTDDSGTIDRMLNTPDVIPLIDVLRMVPGNSAYSKPYSDTLGAPFEKHVPMSQADYANPTTGMTSNDFYACAFAAGDRKPTMIRITIVLDDPLGRLAGGQTFEFIYKLDN